MPYDKRLFDYINTLYDFNNDCHNVIQVEYKSNIVCNSPFNSHKNLTAFISMTLFYNNKKVLNLYKDLKDNSLIEQEIKKMFEKIKN